MIVDHAQILSKMVVSMYEVVKVWMRLPSVEILRMTPTEVTRN